MAAEAEPLARVTTSSVLYPRTLKGLAVKTPDGVPLGRVEDLALDPTDDRIAMVIVVTGGWLGLGNRFIALPWSLVQPAADGTALVVASAPIPHQPPLNRERPEEMSSR
jgi:sporulation protein YlmC with PRC-barrel domain